MMAQHLERTIWQVLSMATFRVAMTEDYMRQIAIINTSGAYALQTPMQMEHKRSASYAFSLTWLVCPMRNGSVGLAAALLNGGCSSFDWHAPANPLENQSSTWLPM
ncbi:hypothetical protein [Pseudomonas tohonis]|uniref:hypothetical protein n=1 Tax=Pseudomonas tohonis TaxID=2725477 RepID=UPI001F31743F|nr:hypothetical protein [Pseudomonas tohonis]